MRKSSSLKEAKKYVKNTQPKIAKLILEFDEYKKMSDVQADDITTCGKRLNHRPQSQFWRRTALRTLMSALEGTIFGAKKIILTFADFTEATFTQGELNIIDEINYRLKESGDIKEDVHKLKIVPNLKFTLKMCAKACKSNPIEYDKDLSKWEGFISAIEIRNEITHPKEFNQLFINDDKQKIIENAASFVLYINKEILRCFQDSLNWHNKKMEEIEKIIHKEEKRLRAK